MHNRYIFLSFCNPLEGFVCPVFSTGVDLLTIATTGINNFTYSHIFIFHIARKNKCKVVGGAKVVFV